MTACQGCGNSTDSGMCCPKCGQLGKQTYFCSQECFTANWTQHSRLHAILLQNKQLTEKEEYRRKSDATSLAMAAIQDLISRLPGSQGKVKKDEDALPIAVSTDRGEHVYSGRGSSSSSGLFWFVVTVFCVGCLWAATNRAKGVAKLASPQVDPALETIRSEMKILRDDMLRRFTGQDEALKRLGIEFEALKSSQPTKISSTIPAVSTLETNTIKPAESAIHASVSTDAADTGVPIGKVDPALAGEAVGQVRKENKSTYLYLCCWNFVPRWYLQILVKDSLLRLERSVNPE